MEERPRVKIVDYVPSDKVDRTKIDEKMKEANVALRLDSFLDQGAVRRVEGILRDLMAEKGHQFAEVKSRVEELPGGPKLVKVVFDINEGPKVKVRDIEFIGNDKISDGKLKKKMKETKEHWFLSCITGRGTFQEDEVRRGRRQDRGATTASRATSRRASGTPEIKTLEDSKDKETRWVQLRIPVTEGARYRVGEVKFDGNTVIKTEFLQPLFKLKTGEYYSEKNVRKGFEKAREVVRRRRLLRVHRLPRHGVPRGGGRPGGRTRAADRERDDAAHGRASSTSSTASRSPATRRPATTSSAARCGSSKAASSAPKR